MPRPAVFLDRDGTILWEVDYLREIKQMRLLPHAAEAIRRLNEANFPVIVVTNQSGIARGLLSEAEYHTIQDAFLHRLARAGARIDRTYYCPHHPQATVAQYRQECECRKPAPGMLVRAAQELDLDLTRSYTIGDRARDLEPGYRTGGKTLLVRTGYGQAEVESWDKSWHPDYVALDLLAAVRWILTTRC